MKILITGGAGYIGSELCTFLNAESFDVKNSSAENVLNAKELDDRISGKDVIYHLAGPVLVKDSLENPFYYWENIVVGTNNVVQSCLRHGCRLLFISTQLVEDKFRCDCCGRLNSPYAEAKLAAEKIVTKTLTNYAIIRLTNVYDYEDKDPYRSRLIPRLRESAKRDGVVKIYPPQTDTVELVSLDEAVKQLANYITSGVGVFKVHGQVKTIGEIAEEIARDFNVEVLLTDTARMI
jgi:nucleoside-diphosphate-sugar epimerase